MGGGGGGRETEAQRKAVRQTANANFYFFIIKI